MFCLKFFERWSTSSEPCPPAHSIVDMPSPTIMDMPCLVMKEILEHSDIWSILILRRVCRDFRQFIDHYMPPWNFVHISIIIDHCIIRLDVEEWNSKEEISIYYHVREHGVEVWQQIGYTLFDSIILENENFVDALIQDFSWILRNQMQKLDGVLIKEDLALKRVSYEVPKCYTFFGCIKREIMCGDTRRYKPFWKRKPNTRRIIDSFARALKFRATPLQVEQITLPVFDQEQLMKILENVDIDSMKTIIVERVYERNSQPSKFLEMEELTKLKEWKNVKEVRTSFPNNPCYLFDF